MASTPIEFDWHSGQSLWAKLIRASDDAEIMAAVEPTERSNAIGSYFVTYTGAVTGHVKLILLTAEDGSRQPDGTLHYRLADTTDIHYPGPAEALATAVALAAVAADLPVRPTKGVAYANFKFPMVLTSDHVTGGTGLTVTAQRSIDDGAFANCANAVVEISAGWYRINLAASDLNGDSIALKFTADTADARFIAITTQPTS